MFFPSKRVYTPSDKKKPPIGESAGAFTEMTSGDAILIGMDRSALKAPPVSYRAQERRLTKAYMLALFCVADEGVKADRSVACFMGISKYLIYSSLSVVLFGGKMSRNNNG